jgi:hypothetical protein
MIGPGSQPLNVKFILPALTEATPLLASDQIFVVSTTGASHTGCLFTSR